MYLKEVEIQNYRLLNNAKFDLDMSTTIIVGRNNSGKTSLMEFINKVIRGSKLTFHDYPISCRESFYRATEKYLNNDLSYEGFAVQVLCPSIKFCVNYDLEKPEESLGSLSPFIIDTDIDTTVAHISVEYRFLLSEENFNEYFSRNEDENDSNEDKLPYDTIKRIIKKKFSSFFSLVIEAVNPKDDADRQKRTPDELSELFPVYIIRAERGMDESELINNNPLSPILARLFKSDIESTSSNVLEETKRLRNLIEKTNEDIEEKANIILADIVQKSLNFGYPNAEEMQLKVITGIALEEQIKSHTDLAYIESNYEEELPSTYNGLGYKNLIKMEFELVEFSRQIEKCAEVAIPLLFLEEPESHMHPQLQQTFVRFLSSFLEEISSKTIQVLLTTHSSHIANAVPFNQIRYVQKQKNQINYKDLGEFYRKDQTNADFIHKYLTLSRCDLFFADKAILIEGTAERLLIPDMINKCKEFYQTEYPNLSSQYYSLIEVGGAYANIFCAFLEYLGIPTLIFTDIDSIGDNRKKTYVSKGKKSSNATINWWIRRALDLKKEDEVTLDMIVNLEEEKKTNGKCHIEYQRHENGLCGRSLEESIINANRGLYKIIENPTEKNIDFENEKKTDFALDLLLNKVDYQIPKYIKEGLCWLDKEKVLGD